MKGVYEACEQLLLMSRRLGLGRKVAFMDTRLVRVVCASCDANYRIASDGVRGKVVDYCCSNCGAVIEVGNGH